MTDEVLDRIDAAVRLVGQLCRGERRWIMSIPAQPNSDPDILIAAALTDAKAELTRLREESKMYHDSYYLQVAVNTKLSAELTRLRAELDQAKGQLCRAREAVGSMLNVSDYAERKKIIDGLRAREG